MPTRIPHTYRTASGTYYLRLVWPKSLRTQFPFLHRDIRLSLNTQKYNCAKQRMHRYLSDFYTLIDLLYKCTYNDQPLDTLTRTRLIACTHIFLDHHTQRELTTMLGLITYESSLGNKIFLEATGNANFELERQALLEIQRQEILLQHQLNTAQETALVSETVSTPSTASASNPYSNSHDHHHEMMEPFVLAQSADPAENQDAHISEVLVESRAETSQKAVTLRESAQPSPAYKASATCAEVVDNTIRPAVDFQDEVTVQMLIDEFIQKVDWENPQTHKKFCGQLRCLGELLGEETPVHRLKKQSIAQVRQQLTTYPKQRFVGKREQLSLAEVLEQDSYKPISSKTVKEYFELLKRLCSFAASQDYIEHDISAGVFIKARKRKTSQFGEAGGKNKDDGRPPFTDYDLIRLFSGYIYGGTYEGRKKTLTAAHFWVPLIGLYSGARLNEICQLMIADVHTEGLEWHGERFSIPHLHITDEHPDQVIKSVAANRKLPIHPKLLEMGFLDFVKQRRSESQNPDNERLLEGLSWDDSTRWGRVVSRWFNGDVERPGYVTKILGDDRSKKVFHSFRHTVADMLLNSEAKLEERLRKAVLGHEGESITDKYGEGYALVKMDKAIKEIKYSDQLETILSKVSFAQFQGFAASIKPRASRRRK